MYINLRHYPRFGVGHETIEASVTGELLPALRREPGFEGYYALWDQDGAGVSVSMFVDADAAHRSTDVARRWVAAHTEFFPERGTEFSGECFAHEQALSSPDMSEHGLYILARLLRGVPATQDMRAFMEQRTLPVIASWPGFRSVYVARSDRHADEVAAVTFFDERQNAEECHEAVVALLGEGLPSVVVTNVLHGIPVIMADSANGWAARSSLRL